MHSGVAAFDVDGTLTVRDCVVPFMRIIAGRVSFVRGGASTLWKVPGSIVGRDRDTLKAHFAREVFRGRRVDDVSAEGERFATFVSENWMRADVVKRLRWHQRSGHQVVLVSASLGPYLRPLGERLGVDSVLCTELDEADGIYSGELRGANCRGAEKVSRLSAWLSGRGIDSETVEWAYGDSPGDRDLLSFARFGTWVGKSDLPEQPS